MQGSLPRPYDLKPKSGKNKSYFTTPMKKLIGYLVLLALVGLVIYEFSPREVQEHEIKVELVHPDVVRGTE